MITPPLRRAVLVLAVIAFLVVRASAQTGSDAAFAAALERGAPTPAQFAGLKAKPQKSAAAPSAAPKADAAVWVQVLETVKRDGKYKAGGGFMPGSFSIEESTGDPKADFSMSGISILGMINEEEQFEAMRAMIVVMESKLDPKDGNYHVDQWMFQTDIYGEVGEVGHGTIIKSPDGKLVGTKRETVDPADPKVQAQYAAMLKHWAERKP